MVSVIHYKVQVHPNVQLEAMLIPWYGTVQIHLNLFSSLNMDFKF
jgi:hypothetical protein